MHKEEACLLQYYYENILGIKPDNSKPKQVTLNKRKVYIRVITISLLL